MLRLDRRAATAFCLLLLVLAYHTSGQAQSSNGSQSVINFEDFSSSTPGEFPTELKWKRASDRGDVAKARKKGIDIFRYIVKEEDGNKYLHIRDDFLPGHSVGVYFETKKFKWEIAKHPILSWRWRINEIPPGADERYTETNDSPAAVTVIFGKKFPFTPISIKYVWSSTLPKGAVAYRPGRGRPHTIVLGTGTENLGEWLTIERNIYDDYVQIHNKKPPKKPQAIVIQSDANRTPDSAADADYDDFKALSSFSPGFPNPVLPLLKEYMLNNN